MRLNSHTRPIGGIDKARNRNKLLENKNVHFLLVSFHRQRQNKIYLSLRVNLMARSNFSIFYVRRNGFGRTALPPDIFYIGIDSMRAPRITSSSIAIMPDGHADTVPPKPLVGRETKSQRFIYFNALEPFGPRRPLHCDNFEIEYIHLLALPSATD